MVRNPKVCTASPRRTVFAFLVLSLLGAVAPLHAQPCASAGPPCVKTGQYDNARDGYNSSESVLTSGNLDSGTTLTQLAPLLVDTPPASISQANPIYAQPLYIAGITLNPDAPSSSRENCANLTVNGQPACNMLLVVTLYGSVWGYNADTGHVIFSRLALWKDCGPNSTVPVNGQGGIGSLPFAGIPSTPVVDTTLSPPAMFLTDVCLDSQAKVHWFLHEVDITNGFEDVPNSHSPLEIAGSNGGATFSAGEVLQRPALLEVENPGGTPANVIYVGFGSAVQEAPNPVTGQTYPYHGWLFAYSTSGANNELVQDFAFNASGTGTSGNPTCNTNAPLCGASGCQAGQFENQPNWCGHGGGIWMSGRGPAANTSNGVARIFVGNGNGGYQTAAANWGSSVLTFHASASAGISAAPADSFTPHGGPKSPFTAPILAGSSCPATLGGTPIPCPYTFETMNENDWDMAISGLLLFEDASKNNWLVTADKSGAGYLLNQNSLGGFTENDTGNHFPFLAGTTACWTLGVRSDACDRVTSLAYFKGSGATGPRYLYYWPYQGLLTGLLFSNNVVTSGIGTVTTGASGPPYTALNLTSGCTFRSTTAPCLNEEVVAGDTITAGGQVQTVTSAGTTTLTVTPGFGTPVHTSSWTYRGYFTKPIYQNSPKTGSVVIFAGGDVETTSDNGTGGLVWGLATIQTAPANPPTQLCPTLTAMLNAYNAATLTQLWSSYNTSNPGHCFGPCFSITPPPPANSCQVPAATYGLPTIVNGSAYIPTYQITGTTLNPSCSFDQPCSGIVVYCGSGTTACNGKWQQ
jgi:hypothetical protein